MVSGPKGPEAGVWVIAETTDLPTKSPRSSSPTIGAATCIPELPKANYNMWVRGYGLVDSPKVKSRARQDAQPDRGAAPSAAEAAEYYPGDVLVFDAEDPGERANFPAPATRATASRRKMKTQEHWVDR